MMDEQNASIEKEVEERRKELALILKNIRHSLQAELKQTFISTLTNMQNALQNLPNNLAAAGSKIQAQSQNIANAVSSAFSKISNNKFVLGAGNAVQLAATNFAKASSLIATAVFEVGSSAAQLMINVATKDLEIDKLANSMNISKEAAGQMKNALDALGVSLEDVEATPELQGRYDALVADGTKMQLGGDYDETMKGFRDLMFEATRFKQEASYAMDQVAYHLMKNLAEPLEDAKAAFRILNDVIVANMSKITAVVAQAISMIINIARPLWEILKIIGKSLYDGWDSFAGYLDSIKNSFKNMGDALSNFGSSALTSIITLFKGLFDAFEKQGAATSFKNLLKQFVFIFNEVSDVIAKSINIIASWLEQASQSDAVKMLLSAIADLGGAFATLWSVVCDLVYTVLKDLFAGFSSTESIFSFGDVLGFIVEVISMVIRIMSYLIEVIAFLFKALKNSEAFNTFVENIGKIGRGIFNTISMVGKLGRALMALLRGEYLLAYKVAKEAFGGADENSLPDALSSSANVAGLLGGNAPSNSYSNNNNSRTVSNSTTIGTINVTANQPQEFVSGISNYLPTNSGLNGNPAV